MQTKDTSRYDDVRSMWRNWGLPERTIEYWVAKLVKSDEEFEQHVVEGWLEDLRVQ